jgi:hypothetical protein
MRRLRVERVVFPRDSDQLTLGTGTDVVSGETTRFVIPPDLVLEVLTAVHGERHPTIEVHEFDVVDWSAWWAEHA